MAAASQWTVFALLITLGAASPARNATRAAAAASACTLPGIFCLDCSALSVCVEIQGKFISYQMESCPGNAPCSKSLKSCSDKHSYCTQGLDFVCTQAGLFPDPFDCNVYHECGDPPANDPDEYPAVAEHTCDIATAYNPKTGKCDLEESDANCGEDSYPVPLCDSIQYSAGAFDLNPNYYWMCLGGVINVLKCDAGRVFNSIHSKCEPDGSGGDTTTEGSTPSPKPYECSGTGLEADPSNCLKYYDCSAPETPGHLACPWGKYYHQRKERCVLGFCPY